MKIERTSPKRAISINAYSAEISQSDEFEYCPTKKKLVKVRTRAEARLLAMVSEWPTLEKCYRERRTVSFNRRRWIVDKVETNESDIGLAVYQAFARHRTTSLAAQDGLDQKELPEVAAMRFIEILRSDIAASVTILTDNEDANYKSEQVAIEVCAEWTNWRDYRIYGESVLQCLAKAVGEREALSAIRENKS